MNTDSTPCTTHPTSEKHHHSPTPGGLVRCTSDTNAHGECLACEVGAEAFIGEALLANRWWASLDDEQQVDVWQQMEAHAMGVR